MTEWYETSRTTDNLANLPLDVIGDFVKKSPFFLPLGDYLYTNNSIMAGKKVIISEEMMQKLVVEEIMSKADIAALGDNRDFKDAVNKALKNNRDADKELEKKVRKIVADSVKVLFRGLWERNNFWTGLINNQ